MSRRSRALSVFSVKLELIIVSIFSKTDFMLHCMLIKTAFPSDAVVVCYGHCLIAHVCCFEKASVETRSVKSSSLHVKGTDFKTKYE